MSSRAARRQKRKSSGSQRPGNKLGVKSSGILFGRESAAERTERCLMAIVDEYAVCCVGEHRSSHVS